MGLEAGNGRGGRSGMSGKQAELSDYGRAHIWEWMEFLSRYAAKQGRTVYAYIDGAISYSLLTRTGLTFCVRKCQRRSLGGSSLGGRAPRRSCQRRTGRM